MSEIIINTKRCTICKQDKPFDAFHKQKNGKFGLLGRCKDCKAKSDHARWAENSEKIYAQQKESRSPGGTQRDSYVARYNRNNAKKTVIDHKTANLKRYGLTLDEFNDMLAAQDYKCAICPRTVDTSEFAKSFHVDHDHNCCGKGRACKNCVRGILCHGCNTGLGAFGDSVESLTNAIAYLLSREGG